VGPIHHSKLNLNHPWGAMDLITLIPTYTLHSKSRLLLLSPLLEDPKLLLARREISIPLWGITIRLP
jgi:hypothetical protein